MTVKYLGDNQYQGLAADTKPVAANTALNATFQETDTYNQYINNGSAWLLLSKNFETKPSYRKTGAYYGVGSTTGCGGMLEGRITGNVGTVVNVLDADGVCISWATLNATNPEVAGHRALSTYTRRDWNPYYSIKFKIISSLANTRFTAGFRSTIGALFQGADPLANLHGVAVHLAAGGSTFEIRHNDGSATSTTVNTGVSAVAGTLYVFECWGDANNSRWTWSINNSAQSPLTTKIPAATQELTIAQNIETTATLARLWYLYYIEVGSDK